MPELPEVEIVRRGLQRSLQGGTLRRVDVREPRLRWPVAGDLAIGPQDRPLVEVGRRGKYLLLDFSSGWLLVHLGMSGSLRFLPEPGAVGRHDHIDLVFDRGTLRYNDPRRFGAMVWHEAASGPVLAHPLLAGLGVEPLSPGFDGDLLYEASRGRTVPVKQFLLAGAIVVGVGNIYASESLFRAGIRPTVAAGRISRPRYRALAEAIRQTLTIAIERGGSTLRNYVSTDGEPGYAQVDALVYARDGQPCRRCGTPIRVIRQQGRATYFCPRCQA
ncbi:MAG: bifunctional DNA-formamidopyrimidine glycosylase/DNA-(apurinic or apyrimidinic site) lyase [Burkholderiaceae bacterium]